VKQRAQHIKNVLNMGSMMPPYAVGGVVFKGFHRCKINILS
jgi:hypothetical protein